MSSAPEWSHRAELAELRSLMFQGIVNAIVIIALVSFLFWYLVLRR